MTPSQPSALSLQPLPGWVNTYYRKYKGRRLGPYYVRRWKVGSKICREYVKAADVERVRAACQRYREPFDTLNRLFRSNDTFVDNFGFLLRIRSLIKRRKPIPILFGMFLRRLTHEGMRIAGRPPLRRKVTREQAIVDGRQVIRKTVHEFDGTTNIFMVPTSTKKQIEPEIQVPTSFEQQFQDLYKAIFGAMPATCKRSPTT